MPNGKAVGSNSNPEIFEGHCLCVYIYVYIYMCTYKIMTLFFVVGGEKKEI